MLFHAFHDKSPIPHLAESIAKQKEFGGRLISYRQAWSCLIVACYQDRVVWVPLGGNRYLAGWRQALFTLLLGPWCLMSFILVPLLLMGVFRGGIDVTELYSNSPIDLLRPAPPIAGTAAREAKRSQYDILILLVLALLLIYWFMIRPIL